MRTCKKCCKSEDIPKKRALCLECHKAYCREYYLNNRAKMISAAKEWREENSEKYSEYMARRHKTMWPEYRLIVLEHYGLECACCGEANVRFLTIDHVENDGHIHRKKMSHAQLYPWLIRNNFKCDFKLQTLCFNCNFGKRYNNGVCPHCFAEGSETIPSGSTP